MFVRPPRARSLSWLSPFTRSVRQPNRKRKPQKTARVSLEQLEDRLVPANTTFSGGVLTVDLNNVNETATLFNDGTNITLTSNDPITGAGASFATASVTQIAITDVGNNAGQSIFFG